jgi:hypothetical protein
MAILVRSLDDPDFEFLDCNPYANSPAQSNISAKDEKRDIDSTARR